jgi:tetratricopeptide (TPR) repeat protein
MNKFKHFCIGLASLLPLTSASNSVRAQFDPIITQPQLPPPINAPAMSIEQQMRDRIERQRVIPPSQNTVSPRSRSTRFTRRQIQHIANTVRNMSSDVDMVSVVCQDPNPKVNGRILNSDETAMLQEELGCKNIPSLEIQPSQNTVSPKPPANVNHDPLEEGLDNFTAGNESIAISYFNQAIENNPRNPAAYAFRGSARDGGDYRGAIADYTKSLQLGSKLNSQKQTLLYFYRGKAYSTLQEYQKAASDFTQVIQLNPKLDSTYVRQGGDAVARFVFDSFNLPTVWTSIDQNQPIAWTQYYDNIPANTIFVVYAYAFRGLARANLNDFQAALSDYTQAIKLDPKFADAYAGRAGIRHTLNDFQAAIADFDRAIQLNPKDINAYWGRGQARLVSKDLQGALADANRAVQLNSQYVPGYALRGAIKRRLQDLQGAIADTDRAIQLDSKYAPAYITRGVARARVNDFRGAFKDINRAIQLNPKLANAYYYRGLVRYLQGDNQGAISDYEQATRLAPELVKKWDEDKSDNYIVAARR